MQNPLPGQERLKKILSPVNSVAAGVVTKTRSDKDIRFLSGSQSWTAR